MGTHPLSEAELRDALAILAEHKGNLTHAAAAAGMSRGGFSDRVRKAEALKHQFAKDEAVQFPAFIDGDEDEPIESILERKAKHFERKATAQAARNWFEIKVKETKPYGVMAFGDAHLDDDGANIPLLQRHLKVAASPGVYGVNIGDSTNNWVGRLERLYANQETSRHTGRRLVDWFMFQSGVKWLCWVLGNHDTWNEGADFHMRLAKSKIPVIDWRAQFQLAHPNGTTCRFDCSHGRKGSSIWNNLHATLRAAKLGELADAYLTGHTHNYGCEDLEIAERKHSAWLVQLRGYKFFDTHALYNNFSEYQRGSSVLLIVDPREEAPRRIIQCFDDIELGYQFLSVLRGAA